jgi:hypothetical protein
MNTEEISSRLVFDLSIPVYQQIVKSLVELDWLKKIFFCQLKAIKSDRTEIMFIVFRVLKLDVIKQ